ncbi:zinc knuckle [Ostertagia ostertagi]
MTSSLSVRQGLLTRSIHRLSSVIRSHEDLLAQSGIREDEEVEDRARRIRRAIVAIEAELGTLESSLEKYAKAADSLERRITQNCLIKRKQALTTLTVLQRGTEPLEVPSVSGSPQISEVKLAPVPVPKFSGEIWEWETFWKTFEHTIHSKNIDNIYKLNYLMDALQGAAKQSVEQFQVSSETYPLVVAHLKKKYGDTQALVDRLLNKLQSAKANSDSLEDQETLCEQLLSITSQLDLHGEHIDNTFLQRELLGKFSIDVQRQILRQKPKLKTEETWSTMALLRTAKEFVEAELRIIRQVKSHSSNNKRKRDTSGMEERKSPLSRNFAKNQLAPCFYCGKTGHPAKNCTEIPSLDQRLEIIKAQKLCRNCGQKDHTAANGFAKDTNSKQETVPDCSSHDNVMLLTGQAKVLNPTTGALESIHIMLDTGADRSFISDELADRLQLTNVDTTELTINTFASQKPMKRTCRNTVMKLWDVDGNQHTFTVTRISTITPTLARSSLSKEDKKFIYENEIHLSIDPSIKKVQPTVLLGCADLFSILGNGLQKQYTLPSGLKVIPSKLGYLISGRSKLQQDDVGKPPVQTIHQVDTQPIRQKPQLTHHKVSPNHQLPV